MSLNIPESPHPLLLHNVNQYPNETHSSVQYPGRHHQRRLHTIPPKDRVRILGALRKPHTRSSCIGSRTQSPMEIVFYRRCHSSRTTDEYEPSSKHLWQKAAAHAPAFGCRGEKHWALFPVWSRCWSPQTPANKIFRREFISPFGWCSTRFGTDSRYKFVWLHCSQLQHRCITLPERCYPVYWASAGREVQQSPFFFLECPWYCTAICASYLSWCDKSRASRYIDRQLSYGECHLDPFIDIIKTYPNAVSSIWWSQCLHTGNHQKPFPLSKIMKTYWKNTLEHALNPWMP